MRTVVGFTPEASAYGPICVEFAAAIGLLRTLYAEGHQRIFATIVAVSLVVMALLSTSSTAYARLGGIGIGLCGELGQARGFFLRRLARADCWGAARRPESDSRAAVDFGCSRGLAEPTSST